MIRTDIAPFELPVTQDWAGVLRRISQVLFALLPLLLLFWRGGADAAATIIGISFLAVVIARRQWGLATHPLLAVLLGIWLLLNLLVSPLAVDPVTSFSRSVAWLRFPLLFAAAVTWLIQSRRDVQLIAGVWAATIAFCILDGLVQLARGTSLTGNPMYNIRITGPLDRPNIGSFVTRIGFPLIAALPLLLSGVQSRLISLAAFAFTLLGLAFIMLTGERTAALLVVIALLTIMFGAILFLPRYRLHSLLALALLSGAGTMLVLASERLLFRVKQLETVFEDFSRSHYAELFSVGLDVWRHYPVFGAGMKNFEGVCKVIAGSYVTDGCPTHPHNVYIEWLAETGAAGLLGYLAFIAVLVFSAWPLLRGAVITRTTGLLVAGCLVLLFFPLAASQSIFSNWPALVFWAGLSMTMAVARLALKQQD